MAKGKTGTRRSGRRCLFCGAGERFTKEHVWPDWMGGVAPALASGETYISGAGYSFDGRVANESPATAESRNVRVNQQQVRNVCAACNSGWMSRLESAAKPVLTPLIRGEDSLLGEGEVATLTLWAAKTTCIADCLQEGEAGLTATETQRRLLYRNQLPWSPFSAWVGRYGGTGISNFRIQRMGGELHNRDGLPGTRKVLLLVLVVGALVLVTWTANGHGVPLYGGDSSKLHDLTPDVNDPVTWPPKQEIDEPGIEALATDYLAQFSLPAQAAFRSAAGLWLPG